MLDLQGRTALVTGASRGIGRELAVRLARAGSAVAVTARTASAVADVDGSLDATVAAISALGRPTVAIAADLADADDRARIVPEIEDTLGPIDILVNNAAAAMYAPVADMPLRRRRLLFEVNVHAPMDLTQHVLPGMIARGHGSIINITSATAKHHDGASVAVSPYGASKAALDRLTEGLAAELRGSGVVVHGIAPTTGVDTPGARVVLGERYAELASRFETVEEFADAVLQLLDASSSFPTILTSAMVTGGR